MSDALQFADPDVRDALDTDPSAAAATRRALFDRLAADRIPFSATHLATPAFGLLEPRNTGFAFNRL